MNSASKSQSFRRWTIWAAGILSLIALPLVVRAVTLPYTNATSPGLVSGQTISASGLWGDFNALNTGKFGNVVQNTSPTVNNCPQSPLGGQPVKVDIGCPAGTTIVGGGCHTNSWVVVAQSGQFWTMADGTLGWECSFVNASPNPQGPAACWAAARCVGP